MAIKGLNSVKAVFEKKVKGYRNGIRAITREVGEDIEFLAKLYAPEKIDSLISGKVVSNRNGYGYLVEVSEMPGPLFMRNMPVYLEFGTGVSAGYYVNMLPKEWQDAARKYYINGKGTTQAHSYLFPAWNARGTKYIDRVKEVLRK